MMSKGMTEQEACADLDIDLKEYEDARDLLLSEALR